jgi:phage-related protein
VANDEQPSDKPVVILHGEIKTPPFSVSARIEAGHNLWILQKGELIPMPHSRPMPVIGPRCHELRINDEQKTWRIIYRIDPHAVLIADVFEKRTQRTPPEVIENAARRLRNYDEERSRRNHGH